MLTKYRARHTIDKYITYLLGVQTRFAVAGVAGFEPTNDGVRVRGLTAWRHPFQFECFNILAIFRRNVKRFSAL